MVVKTEEALTLPQRGDSQVQILRTAPSVRGEEGKCVCEGGPGLPLMISNWQT